MMQQLGRYELARFVARGGMAEVFEAYSVGAGGFRRRVAVKRLLADDAADSSLLRMFLDEARICSALHHTGIVAVLDFGVVDGAPFQVMEYVDGINAAELVKKLAAAGTSMPELLALHVTRVIAYALAHAHEATDADGPLGIVHRDVKPANILLSWDGDVKLADFGIALGRARQERTEAGQVKGTLNYMAPEQIAGLPVDARADVFALGCVLHALIAGVSPIAAMGSAVPLLRGELAPIHPSLSPDIVAIARRALEGEPSMRFSSARIMAEALDAAVAARTNRDPRAELEKVLFRIRPPAKQVKVGALDHLLDLAFVPTDNPHEFRSLQVPTATVRDAEVAATAPLIAPPPGAPRMTLPMPPPAARPRAERRAPWLAMVGGAAFLLGGGAGVYALSRRGSSLQAAPSPSVAVSTIAVVAAPPIETDAPRSPPPPEPVPEPSASVNAAARAIKLPTSRAASPSSAPVALEGTGFVAFRALDGATRTTIVVDGQPRGFAPKVLELPTGPHAVSYLDASGTPFGTTRIVVTQDFSRGSPKILEVTARAD